MTTGSRLRVDAVTAEVTAALKDGGIPSLLLKGPSTQRWLWGDAGRTYADTDLLVPPKDVHKAEKVLRQLGFAAPPDDGGLGSLWREREWSHPVTGRTVDLHQSFVGMRASPETVWEVLSADTEEMVVLGRPVAILSVPARALILALHAARHGPRLDRPREDQERAISRVSAEHWRAALALARRLDAVDAFAAGLRQASGGKQLAVELGVPRSSDVEVALRVGPISSRDLGVALGLNRVSQIPGWRAKMEILLHEVFPTATFMKAWWQPAGRGPLWLIVAYVYRPLWLARKLPKGIAALMRARADVRTALRSGPTDDRT